MLHAQIQAALTCALLLSSCGSTPQKRSFSLLPGSPPSVELAPWRIDVQVSTPGSLERQGIVLADGAHGRTEASDHLWAEPLREGIQAALEDLLRAAPNAPRALLLDIHRFHGTRDGAVVLDADWIMTDAQQKRSHGRFSHSVAQEGAGYDALVRAMHGLLEQLTNELAGDTAR